MIMCEFMSENGLYFLCIQQTKNRPRENNVTFTGNKEKRGIRLRTILCLVERDWDLQAKPRFGFIEMLVKFGMTFCLESVSGFKQLHSKALRVISQSMSRGKPFPQIAFMQFEIISNLDVKSERIENTARFFEHCF